LYKNRNNNSYVKNKLNDNNNNNWIACSCDFCFFCAW